MGWAARALEALPDAEAGPTPNGCHLMCSHITLLAAVLSTHLPLLFTCRFDGGHAGCSRCGNQRAGGQLPAAPAGARVAARLVPPPHTGRAATAAGGHEKLGLLLFLVLQLL